MSAHQTEQISHSESLIDSALSDKALDVAGLCLLTVAGIATTKAGGIGALVRTIGVAANLIEDTGALQIWEGGSALIETVLTKRAAPMVADTMDSTVAITLESKVAPGKMLYGNGVLVNDHGIVATVAHIAEAAKDGTLRVITSDGSSFPAEVKALSTTGDAALLKINTGSAHNMSFHGIRFPELPPTMKNGDELVSVGWGPEGGTKAERQASISAGRFYLKSFFSSVREPEITIPGARLPFLEEGELPHGNFILAKPPKIKGPGFSGGPVIDAKNNQLVGLTSWGQRGTYHAITPLNEILALMRASG